MIRFTPGSRDQSRLVVVGCDVRRRCGTIRRRDALGVFIKLTRLFFGVPSLLAPLAQPNLTVCFYDEWASLDPESFQGHTLAPPLQSHKLRAPFFVQPLRGVALSTPSVSLSQRDRSVGVAQSALQSDLRAQAARLGGGSWLKSGFLTVMNRVRTSRFVASC